MPHVGVERFATGNREEHAAQDCEVAPATMREQARGMARIDCRENHRLPDDRNETEQADDAEPDQHDGTENLADRAGAALLKPEEPDQDDDRTGQHVWLERGARELQSLERAEYGDRRRDDAVAIDQRRTEQPHGDQGARGAHTRAAD